MEFLRVIQDHSDALAFSGHDFDTGPTRPEKSDAAPGDPSKACTAESDRVNILN